MSKVKDIHFGNPAEGVTSNVLNFETALAMANLAYATSRGIIYTRCEATGIGQVILPVLLTADLEKILRRITNK